MARTDHRQYRERQFRDFSVDDFCQGGADGRALHEFTRKADLKVNLMPAGSRRHGGKKVDSKGRCRFPYSAAQIPHSHTQLVHDSGVTELVIVGMMSSMCIDSTAWAAHEFGFDVTVVSDACAAPDLTFDDVIVPFATVHASFMAALDGSFASVIPSRGLLEP